MGTDCYLFCDGEFHQLDRWYRFSDIFESTEMLSKEESLKRLDSILQKKVKSDWLETIKECQTANYQEEEDIFFYWLKEAKKIIETSKGTFLIFYTEHDKPNCYFNSGFILQEEIGQES